jgi:septum formation protein
MLESPNDADLLLASTSRFRRRMLEAAGLDFECVPPEVDEAVLKRKLTSNRPLAEPGQVALALARAKANAVSTQFPVPHVVGADQVLAMGGALFDKPPDLAAARRQLQTLRGRTHQLHTAAVLAKAGETVWSRVEVATLVMRDFSDAFLDKYLEQAGPGVCHTVGGYEVEGRGIQLFERIEGDHFTIIGLPLLALLAELRAQGIVGT